MLSGICIHISDTPAGLNSGNVAMGHDFAVMCLRRR
jgi:hypothetical protein